MAVSRRSFVRVAAGGAVGSFLTPFVSARGLEATATRLALGGRAGDVVPAGAIRLDSNENPNGPGPASLDAIRAAIGEVCRYPDDAVETLGARVAAFYGTSADHVLLGCGSTDVLRAAVYAFTAPDRALVTASPAYESPVENAGAVGAPVRAVPVSGTDLRLDLDAMVDAARGAGLVYFCNPNNPTSTVHGADAVKEFVTRALRDTPTLTILVDEAYHDYVDDPRYATAIPLALDDPRVVVARTFSKVYGMAGLRVGYAVGRPETIKAMRRHVLDLGVNRLGAAAALAGLEAREHVERERALNREARAFTLRAFERMGYAPAASQTNFVMVNVRRDAKQFREACKRDGVLIGRRFPPLDSYARVTIGTMDEMRRATEVFRRVLETA